MALLQQMQAAFPPSDLLRLDPLPDGDWFFQTMREVIAENRRREDETSG